MLSARSSLLAYEPMSETLNVNIRALALSRIIIKQWLANSVGVLYNGTYIQFARTSIHLVILSMVVVTAAAVVVVVSFNLLFLYYLILLSVYLLHIYNNKLLLVS